jgi:hypothetical protein
MPLTIWDVAADTAALVIGAGAAALLAAVTAQARLRAQLRHDAQMRERDATRDALNAVVTEITGAVGAMNAAAEGSSELRRVRSATLKTGEDWGLDDAEAAVRNAIEQLRGHRAPLMAASFRLHLRFPDTDPIIARLAEWRETFIQLAEDYQAALDSGDFEMAERFDAASETALELGKRLNAFLDVARDWGSNPPR